MDPLVLRKVVCPDGFVDRPRAPAPAYAAGLVVFDRARRARLVAFSRDPRASLRRLLARRPNEAWYYARQDFPLDDVTGMTLLQARWLREIGGTHDVAWLAGEVPPGTTSADIEGALRARGVREPLGVVVVDGRVAVTAQGTDGSAWEQHAGCLEEPSTVGNVAFGLAYLLLAGLAPKEKRMKIDLL